MEYVFILVILALVIHIGAVLYLLGEDILTNKKPEYLGLKLTIIIISLVGLWAAFQMTKLNLGG